MARKKSEKQLEKVLEQIKNNKPKFKLKLDNRTTITLKTKEQLDKWMLLYPKAELITQ